MLIVLVGNKSDLCAEGEGTTARVVMTADAKQFAEEKGIASYETSAKEATNVKEMFTTIGMHCICKNLRRW
eukprot:m.114883 g.114883  ORF g.114883 m.114883 type:complete len:71 (-) comp51905_c0_seq5:247-459(-)